MDNLSLKHSSVSGKTPTAEQLEYGEVAVNYNANHPFLSIKDTNNKIRTISDDGVISTQVEQATLGVKAELTSAITQNTADITNLSAITQAQGEHVYTNNQTTTLDNQVVNLDCEQALYKGNEIATTNNIPTTTSQLSNDSGYITGYTESDPIWTSEKDSYYTKDEVDNKGYITGYTESDPVWTADKADYYTKTEVDNKISSKSSKTIIYLMGNNSYTDITDVVINNTSGYTLIDFYNTVKAKWSEQEKTRIGMNLLDDFEVYFSVGIASEISMATTCYTPGYIVLNFSTSFGNVSFDVTNDGKITNYEYGYTRGLITINLKNNNVYFNWITKTFKDLYGYIQDNTYFYNDIYVYSGHSRYKVISCTYTTITTIKDNLQLDVYVLQLLYKTAINETRQMTIDSDGNYTIKVFTETGTITDNS